mmetsp:Transcript_28480/g.60674  ORF Transcript_28480/g.60674 Transcript_28480/m.60674 type:complete len:84 (+) Transcript_28480:1132-1383(+)
MRARKYIIATLQHLDESDWRMNIVKEAGLDFTRYGEASKLKVKKEAKKKADTRKEIQNAVDLSSEFYQNGPEIDVNYFNSLFN